MPQSDVFSAVAAESADQANYSPELHERVDALVEEWLQAPERSNTPFGSSDGGFEGDANNCTEFVKAAYEERFADQHPGFGVPLVGFVLMSILGGIISWLVQRTLDRKFPRAPGASDSVGGNE
jgi:hypothetical protein